MTARRIRFWLAIVGITSTVVGCSAVGTMPKDVDEQAKNMTPTEGKALVYVVRPARIGMAVGMRVSCDGHEIGYTGGKRFIYAVLDSGAHVFASQSENKSELPLVLEAGKIYYLEQQVKMGLIVARSKLVRLNDEEGRKKLLKCSLSKHLGPKSQVGTP